MTLRFPKILRTTLLLAVAVSFAACGEDEPTAPEIMGGAGLRVILPQGYETLEDLRVEIWHDNAVPPPRCPSNSQEASVQAIGPQQDSCSRMSVDIWDLLGRPVRTEASVPSGGEALGWNTLDNEGEEVNSGIYFTHQACLDSEGEWTFEGSYYVWRAREQALCQWPLLIEEVDASSSTGLVELSPIPVLFQTVTVGFFGEILTSVTFENPFLVRVRAGGYQSFEAEVRLTEGRYTEVEVTLEPLTPRENISHGQSR